MKYGHMLLTIKQTQAIEYLEDSTTTEIGFGGGAGGGKSVLGAYWQLKRRLVYPKTRGLIGRAKLKTLKETTLNTLFEVARMEGWSHTFTLNSQTNQLIFTNGSIIFLKDMFLYPSDPNFDELGSLEITDAFLDESSQISKKGYDILRSRIRYKLDENNLIPKTLWASNPSKNWNYYDFYKPSADGTIDKHKRFVQALADDNQFISKHYLENLSKLSEIDKQRLLFGNWEYDDDPSKLIEYEKILDLYSNSFVEKGEKYITADIARYGSDLAVIMVWDGMRLIKILDFDKSSTTFLADTITGLRNQYSVPLSNVIVDEDGVGGGVKDILDCKGFINNAKPKTENFALMQYQNLKTQCYFHLAEAVNENKIYIETEKAKDRIIEELENVKRYNIDKDGKLSILPKDKVKETLGRSPDYADAMMMRMWFEIGNDFKFSIA